MIYIIVGKPCSGKTTAREYLQDRYGFVGFEASQFVKKEKTRYEVDSIAILLKTLGRDFPARLIYQKMPKNTGVIISGFRMPEEIEFIKSQEQCKVIGLYASDRRCFERSSSRRRYDYERDFETFCTQRLDADYALGLSDIMHNYIDIIIDNDSSQLLQLYQSLDNIIGDANE